MSVFEKKVTPVSIKTHDVMTKHQINNIENKDSVKFLNLINEFSEILNISNDFADCITNALKYFGNTMQYNKVYFFQKTPQIDVDNFVLLFDFIFSDNNVTDYFENIYRNQVFDMNDFKDIYEKLKSEGTILLHYSEIDNNIRSVFDNLGLFSTLISIVRKADEIIGFLLINNSITNPDFSNTEIGLIRNLANQLANYLKINSLNNELYTVNDRLLQFTNNISDGILITENYRMVYVNEKFCDIYNLNMDFFNNGDLNNWDLLIY